MKYFILFFVVLVVAPVFGELVGAHNERIEWQQYIDEHECTKSPISDHWWKCLKPTPHHLWKE